MTNLLAEAIVTSENAAQIMGEHFWALVPPVLAIILAMITKEVYISLFLGVFVGGLISANWNPINALQTIFEIMAESMGPEIDEAGAVVGAGNAGILIFILELGILVALMNKAGGGRAFGNWVHKNVKSRKGALLATTGLGCLIFMDDYFNRLAVGTIMQPINDKYRISRAKSAFLVGSISVSICILIPVSSWASAIAGNIGEGLDKVGASFDSFNVYIDTISRNFYPILLIAFLALTSFLGIDLFGLRKHEHNAIKTGDLLCGFEAPGGEDVDSGSPKGRVIDLVLPILVLIASCCVLLLIKKDGETIYPTNSALAMGGCIAIIFSLILYLPRRLMTLKEFTGCFGTGFKSIADVFIILVFAWALTGVCGALNLDLFVQAFATWMGNAKNLLPAIFFVAAMGTAFATGTSWGTFGIMVPIVAPMITTIGYDLMVLTIAAVLSGSVFGDQVSPISDATILSASATKSNHLAYVKAQLPNALMVAAIAFTSFLVAGLTGLIWLGWIVAVVLLAAFIVVAYVLQRKNSVLTDDLYKQVMASEQAQTETEVAATENA